VASKDQASNRCEDFSVQDTLWRGRKGTVVTSAVCLCICGLQLGKLWFSGAFLLMKNKKIVVHLSCY